MWWRPTAFASGGRGKGIRQFASRARASQPGVVERRGKRHGGSGKLRGFSRVRRRSKHARRGARDRARRAGARETERRSIESRRGARAIAGGRTLMRSTRCPATSSESHFMGRTKRITSFSSEKSTSGCSSQRRISSRPIIVLESASYHRSVRVSRRKGCR